MTATTKEEQPALIDAQGRYDPDARVKVSLRDATISLLVSGFELYIRDSVEAADPANIKLRADLHMARRASDLMRCDGIVEGVLRGGRRKLGFVAHTLSIGNWFNMSFPKEVAQADRAGDAEHLIRAWEASVSVRRREYVTVRNEDTWGDRRSPVPGVDDDSGFIGISSEDTLEKERDVESSCSEYQPQLPAPGGFSRYFEAGDSSVDDPLSEVFLTLKDDDSWRYVETEFDPQSE